MRYFDICAHRGGDFRHKQIPPNSLRGFEESYAIGVNGIETDVCLSKDNEPIICHPGLLRPDPAKMNWKEIRQQYPFIPHFNDLLDYIRRKPFLTCFLDLKVNSKTLAEKVCDGIFEASLTEKIILTAPRKRIAMAGLYSSGELLAYAQTYGQNLVNQSARGRHGRIKTHVIDIWPVNMAKTAEQFEPDIISFGWLNDSLLSRLAFHFMFKTKVIDPFIDLSDEIHKAKSVIFGLKVFGGIANTPETINYLLDAGVDGIVTDNPALAVEIRNSQISQ